MLIYCPIKSEKEIQPLVDAGADIFYAGIKSDIIFGNDIGVANRRPWDYANFISKNELKIAINLIHKKNKKINITINEHFYSSKQISKIVKFVNYFSSADGFIVVDINIIRTLKKEFPKIKLIASAGTHIINNETINFYKELGIKEIILPRHLKTKEIGKLINNHKNVDFKCFIKNEDCANIDGLCCYSHGLFKNEKYSACELLHDFCIYGKNKKQTKILFERYKNYQNIILNQCGVCALYKFKVLGVKGVKIVGRTLPLKQRIQDVKFVKDAIDNIKKYNTFKKYNTYIKNMHYNIYNKRCLNKCFYK